MDPPIQNGSKAEPNSENGTGTVFYDVDSEFAWCNRQRHPFSRLYFGSPGHKAAVSDTNDALVYFRLFVTSLILELIVNKTNKQTEKLSVQGWCETPAKPTNVGSGCHMGLSK